MPAEARITVIIPAYNAQETIASAIEAVMAQAYAGSVELVVVDDGSTDQTKDVVARYPEVRLIRQENTGPAGARNQIGRAHV